MKSKNFFKGLMSLLIVASSLSLSCMDSKKTIIAEKSESKVDSIGVEYYRTGFETFAAITPQEFANDLGESNLVLKDSAEIDLLSQKVMKLEKDTINNMMDARIMLVLFKERNDTLWVSTHPGHNMQLGRQMVKPDSCLWIYIRNILSEKDSIFEYNLKNAECYLINDHMF